MVVNGWVAEDANSKHCVTKHVALHGGGYRTVPHTHYTLHATHTHTTHKHHTHHTQAKEMIEDMGFAKGGNVSVIGAAMIAGFFASACSLPFDYVKTQIQKMKPDPVTGELPYKSPIDCAMKTLRAGGPLKFYTGFPTYFVRIAPHGVWCGDVVLHLW